MHSFRLIDTFLSAVRHQSLSKAATALNLAQTTVSKRIQMLEQELGHELLERGKGIKTLRLTPAGEEFFRQAERLSLITAEIDSLRMHGPKLPLVVGAVDSLNSFILPLTYQAINQDHPAVKLEIRTLHSLELYTEVENKRVDIAFVLRERITPNVIVEKCFESPMVVLTSEKFRHIRSRDVSPTDLNPDFELSMPWGGEPYHQWHNLWWDPLTPSRIKLDTANLLFSLLRRSQQWAIVPLWVARSAQQRGQYFIYKLTDPPPKYTCYKLTQKHAALSTLKAAEIFDRCFRLPDEILR